MALLAEVVGRYFSNMMYKCHYRTYSIGTSPLIPPQRSVERFVFCFCFILEFECVLLIQSALFGQPSLPGDDVRIPQRHWLPHRKGAGFSPSAQADWSPPLSINPSPRRERSVRLMARTGRRWRYRGTAAGMC